MLVMSLQLLARSSPAFGRLRTLRTLVDAKGQSVPRGFQLYADFFTLHEQHILLASALQKLDLMEGREFRRRKKSLKYSPLTASSSLQSHFLPDDYYQFEQGHYDGVIHRFREMHVTTWPEYPQSSAVLDRLRPLCPNRTPETQTHLLHLATDGEILPHVDNVLASGSWILGVSLGCERIMRMENVEDSSDFFDVLLPSGSVYLQMDTVRFGYKHSILKDGVFLGRHITTGQRMSIMIRDVLPLSSG